jgi:hypothetical protein
MPHIKKFCRSLLPSLLMFLIVFTPIIGLTTIPNTVFAAGEVEISTWEDLASISEDLDADYILMNDLGPLDVGYDTYASSTSNDGVGWIPIGDGQVYFTGSFDGQEYTITGLTINNSTSYNGLFGAVSDATISNLQLDDVTITLSGGDTSGALVGRASDNVFIDNVSVDGTISGTTSYIGGLVGIIEDNNKEDGESRVRSSSVNVLIDITGSYSGGLASYIDGNALTIENSHATGDVEGSSRVGGLVGSAQQGATIRDSYATGSAESEYGEVGGLIGYLRQGLIFSSYATGSVTGAYQVGGLIGNSWYGIVANTFSTGSVVSEGYNIGGLIGSLEVGAPYSITGSFWNIEANDSLNEFGNESNYYGVTGLQSEDFSNEEIFTEMGWDFENVWMMGDLHPEIRNDGTYFEGSGTEEDPYLIGESCAQLANARFYFDSYFKLTDDIDCSETVDWHDGAGFMGIAYPFENYKFRGVFDGNDKTISGIEMNQEYSDYTGLFRHIDTGAEVFDLTLENVNIQGDDQVGALAGGLEGTVTNVHANGVVFGDNNVGGLVGMHAEGYGLSNSSPLVYSWDGDSYEYVADVGEIISRGTDGEDFTVIDTDKIAPKGDVYAINISQEYNEIVYYDKLSLMLFEHAPGYTVVEPMMREVSYDTLTTVSDTPSNPLQSCVDMYGNECVDDLKNYDDKWSYKDDSDVNEWIMDFGDLSDADRVQLVLRAARDYEATPDYDHRTVSVMGPDGEWVQVYGRKELASDGTPRLRTIDLTGKFLTDDYRVKFGFDRLRVNSVAIDTSPEQSFTMQEIGPSKADLSFRGYTSIDKTFFNDHDYENISGTPPEMFANQIGNFTKYGDVLPLITEAEDQFVIMRHGDHVEFEFPYQGSVTPGKERSFILFSDVVYKHADEETGRTVEPLPFQGMESYPSEGYPMTSENIDYLNTWNTRVYSGPIGGGSTIIDSSADVDVIGGSDAGGLVGENQKLILRSYATGYVYASSGGAGGLVGYNYDEGQIEESYADNEFPEDEEIIVLGEAPVESACTAGGLVGVAYYSSPILNSFTRSNVYTSGDCNAGGFVGELTSVTVENSYSTGVVTAVEENSVNIGGFIGFSSFQEIINSFWNGEVNNEEMSGCEYEDTGDCGVEGGLVEKTIAELQTIDTFTTSLGEGSWDFEEMWGINDVNNDGYPFFLWQDFVSEDEEEVVEEEPEEENNSPRRRGGSRKLTPNTSSNTQQSSQSNNSEDRISNIKKILIALNIPITPEIEILLKSMSDSSTNTGSVNNNSGNVQSVRDIELGMTGDDVKSLQTLLIAQGYSIPAGATGFFGAQTKDALSKYQSEHGISPAIGYFGSVTRAEMKGRGLSGLWW